MLKISVLTELILYFYTDMMTTMVTIVTANVFEHNKKHSWSSYFFRNAMEKQFGDQLTVPLQNRIFTESHSAPDTSHNILHLVCKRDDRGKTGE